MLQRIFQIPWMDRVRQDNMIRKADIEKEFFNLIKEERTFDGYLSLVVRGKRYSIRLIIEMKIEGKSDTGDFCHGIIRNL